MAQKNINTKTLGNADYNLFRCPFKVSISPDYDEEGEFLHWELYVAPGTAAVTNAENRKMLPYMGHFNYCEDQKFLDAIPAPHLVIESGKSAEELENSVGGNESFDVWVKFAYNSLAQVFYLPAEKNKWEEVEDGEDGEALDKGNLEVEEGEYLIKIATFKVDPAHDDGDPEIKQLRCSDIEILDIEQEVCPTSSSSSFFSSSSFLSSPPPPPSSSPANCLLYVDMNPECIAVNVSHEQWLYDGFEVPPCEDAYELLTPLGKQLIKQFDLNYTSPTNGEYVSGTCETEVGLGGNRSGNVTYRAQAYTNAFNELRYRRLEIEVTFVFDVGGQDVECKTTLCYEKRSPSSGGGGSTASEPPSDGRPSEPPTPEPPSLGSFKDAASTAIVPASFYEEGYTALYIVESPDIRFEDVREYKINKRVSSYLIDPRFLEVCEPNSIVVVGCVPDEPCLVGAKVLENKLQIKIAKGDLPNKIIIKFSGIRKGFLGTRFGSRTKAQFEANEEFINSAYALK